MENQIASEIDGVADTACEVDLLSAVDTIAPEAAPTARPIALDTTPSLEEFAIETGLAVVDSMGSGDASAPVSCSALTVKDVQDMILPDPSIVNLLRTFSDSEESTRCHCILADDAFHPRFLDSPKDNQTTKLKDQAFNVGKKLSSKDILEIQKLCKNKGEEDPETKLDLLKVDVIFRCESCQEMPISSETVHICNFCHQVCGNCYDNGVRTCVVCKGHIQGNNVPLQNVLQRLRQKYPVMFLKGSTVRDKDIVDNVWRFYSLKPLECPEDGCKCQSSARSLPIHFRTEHKHVPAIDLPLFKSYEIVLPKNLLLNLNGNVIAVVNLKITDKAIASEMFTDTVTCWVQSGAIPNGKENALAVWVSCAYEESLMPPILYSVRMRTADRYSSFAGQMIPLHCYKDPNMVVNDGKCLLIYPEDVEHGGFSVGITSLELKFYPR